MQRTDCTQGNWLTSSGKLYNLPVLNSDPLTAKVAAPNDLASELALVGGQGKAWHHGLIAAQEITRSIIASTS